MVRPIDEYELVDGIFKKYLLFFGVTTIHCKDDFLKLDEALNTFKNPFLSNIIIKIKPSLINNHFYTYIWADYRPDPKNICMGIHIYELEENNY